MNFNPYCPNCGKEIKFLEHYDLSDDRDDEDLIIAYATRYCEECDTNYKWKDIYVLKSFEDLEKI